MCRTVSKMHITCKHKSDQTVCELWLYVNACCSVSNVEIIHLTRNIIFSVTCEEKVKGKTFIKSRILEGGEGGVALLRRVTTIRPKQDKLT